MAVIQIYRGVKERYLERLCVAYMRRFESGPRTHKRLASVLFFGKEGDITGTSTVISSTDWASVITAITSQISVANVVGVLAVAATASIGFVFMWWGARKATRMLMGAFRKGRLRL